MDSQQILTSVQSENSDHESSVEEEGSESSYSSYYSDSDSTIPEWEPCVDDFSGELLYIECHPFVVQNNKENKTRVTIEPFSKNQLRLSTRGKFLRLIRKRQSKKKNKKTQKLSEVNETVTSKVKFQDSQEGEEKEVILEIDPQSRHNLSSDKSLAESLLGLIVSTLSDGNRVMIAGFSYDSKAKHERNIKIGDWLKSINNLEVNVKNLDDILQKFINRDNVLLKLQRVAGVDVTKDPPINELNNESIFVKELLSNNLKFDDEQVLFQTLCKFPVGVVLINMEQLNENSKDNEDIMYVYPKSSQNILAASRGMYTTLNHLLNEITMTKPKTTLIKYKGDLTYIAYTNFDKRVLFFMLPANRITREEIVLINDQIIRVLEFMFKTADHAFTNEQYLSQINYFFSRFFAKTLSSGLWTSVQQFLELVNCSTMPVGTTPFYFEEVMPIAPTLPLPVEAQMQIDDALTELEASDYRDWNEEPLDCQRLFTILGSALYHAGYLLSSHLIHKDLVDAYVFCLQQGLFHLSRTEPVKSIVLWREVFPFSCNKLKNTNTPNGKRYLLIVGSAKDLLVVIMEAGGCTEPPENNMGPDAFYVEEAQATLAHIQELGLSELAERLLSMEQNPQITMPTLQFNKRKNDFINFGFPKNTSSCSKDSACSPKKNEVTSILKRRSSDQNFIHNFNSENSLQDDSFDGHSEGSSSQGGYSERSEISGDSRRGYRKSKYDSNDEDSETEDCGDSSQISVSSFDISEIRQSLLSATEENKPKQLTAGNENILIHYCQLDITEGILLCAPEILSPTPTYKLIINNFKKCCLKMHDLFQNTQRFKNMPTQDIAKSMINKSLVAIKEYAILFECPFLDDKENKKNKIAYWVIGRLFYMPHLKEMYVCYQDGIPQCLVEIAFKMDMNTVN